MKLLSDIWRQRLADQIVNAPIEYNEAPGTERSIVRNTSGSTGLFTIDNSTVQLGKHSVVCSHSYALDVAHCVVGDHTDVNIRQYILLPDVAIEVGDNSTIGMLKIGGVYNSNIDKGSLLIRIGNKVNIHSLEIGFAGSMSVSSAKRLILEIEDDVLIEDLDIELSGHNTSCGNDTLIKIGSKSIIKGRAVIRSIVSSDTKSSRKIILGKNNILKDPQFNFRECFEECTIGEGNVLGNVEINAFDDSSKLTIGSNNVIHGITNDISIPIRDKDTCIGNNNIITTSINNDSLYIGNNIKVLTVSGDRRCDGLHAGKVVLHDNARLSLIAEEGRSPWRDRGVRIPSAELTLGAGADLVLIGTYPLRDNTYNADVKYKVITIPPNERMVI